MLFTKHTSFIIILLLLSIVYSCKDKTPEPSNCTPGAGCQSVLAAKEFFLFKPGSWWVYEEEYSGVRDSMYVYNYANGSDYNFNITIKSALDNFEYNYWPEYNGQPNDDFCSKTNPINKKCMAIKRSKGKPGAPGVFISEGRCMFFQYNLHDSVYSDNIDYVGNYIHVLDIKESYQLGTLDFTETIKVLDPHDKQSRNHRSYHYFSRGVGLVRLELADTTETWNLVNYHIQP